MRSSNIADTQSAAEIIALSKARRMAGREGTGTTRQPAAGAPASTLPEDVVTLSSQQPAPDPAPLRKTASQPVTPVEKRALLGPDNTPYKLSIYG